MMFPPVFLVLQVSHGLAHFPTTTKNTGSHDPLLRWYSARGRQAALFIVLAGVMTRMEVENHII